MSRTWLALTAALLFALSACHLDQRYITPESGPVWQLAMAADTPPYFSSEDVTIYLVEQRVEFPVRAPSDSQLASLSTGDAAPFPRMPWVSRDDLAITIDVTITNLGAETRNFGLAINGINEFNEYVPGVSIVGDDVIIDFAQWERTYRIEPGGRHQVTIREEELDEVAVDLATVVNGAPNPNQIVYFENQSDHDPRSMRYVPNTIPGLVGLRIGLTVQGGDVAPPAALEATIRVRDPSDRLVSVGETGWMLPQPAPFSPADVAMMN